MLEVNNLCKAFDELVVLDDVSFKVKEGENFVVFGRSGTGKSVLLKCISKLLDPDEGEILFEGKDVLALKGKELNSFRKEIGFLFQGAALYDSMSVRENLEFALRNFKVSLKDTNEKVEKVLEQVGLEQAIDKMPSELSGGMKKRIGLARTIITEPKLILYDEPTTGLDPITVKEISHLIVELQKAFNTTSVVVTHDLICAQIVSDHAVVLKDAKIKYQGKLEELVKEKDPFLQTFFSMDDLDVKEGVSNNG
jgi:phospholipid/cholesterol/gamma-HCH transport system ATP-binding protein